MLGNMMKLGIVVWLCLLCGVMPGWAQKADVNGFLPLTWEQASILAARENKLVFVDVMSSGMKQEAAKQKALFSNPRVAYFLKRNAVMIRMDMGTPEGTAFAPRLLMNMYPVYAFFMPYGDLLATASPYKVTGDPLVLVEAGEKALRVAEVKRNNSRSVRFEDKTLEQALELSRQTGKMVFVDAYTDYCQPCLLMERNVFTLDSVADFYNRNFINVKLHFGKLKGLSEKYKVAGYPSFLFLNGEGKLIYKAGGYSSAEQFIGYGQQALKKAKGVEFRPLRPEEAVKEAKEQGKFVFVSVYDVADRRYKEMQKNVFTSPEVMDLLTERFVNVGWESLLQKELRESFRVNTLPAFIILDAGGNEMHRFIGSTDTTGLLREVHQALDGKGLTALAELYRSGNRQPEFMEAYGVALGRADLKEAAGKVVLEYLSGLEGDCLKEPKNWELFKAYVTDANSPLFDELRTNCELYSSLYGKEAVDRKIKEIWAAGADRFVVRGEEGYTLDESGLKEYTKRMKKAKVKDWRAIVRNTKMLAAERTGNWKVYVELAEEKWNEEDISDAELYSWGVKINQECQDEAIRFKAARWFAFAAMEMEQKERKSGKVNISSYKSFFEKLVDDLVGKKK